MIGTKNQQQLMKRQTKARIVQTLNTSDVKSIVSSPWLFCES